MKFLPFSLAIVYGLLMRFVFGFADGFLQVLSIGFVFAVPLGIGALTVGFSKIERVQSGLFAFFAPWLSVLGLLIVTMAIAIEGWICWVIMFPIFAIVAGIGGLIMRAWMLRRARLRGRDDLGGSDTLDDGDIFHDKDHYPAIGLMLLPFLVATAERAVDFKPQAYEIYTTVDVRASEEKVWANVARVHPIQSSEEQRGINAFLGMPRPIRAELDTLAVGGKRRAIFDKGLVFDEVVFEYKHLRDMAFSIDADPREIPPTAMDEHIVIGGKYFDVLEGRYRLEPLPDGVHQRLHLTSRFVLHSPMNWYAGFWAQWIMRDIQDNILHVLKNRSEA
jgi:hypothetical protein